MKKFLAVLLSGTMLVSLAGFSVTSFASESAETTSDKKIGGLYASLSFDFQIQMSNGIQRAADEFGYEYMSYDYNLDSEQMLSGFETLLASNVGAFYGLFLSPETATDMMEANPDVGVLTQGELVEGAQSYTANDYVALAEQFVEALDNYVTEQGITEGDIAALWLETCENEDSSYYDAKEEIKEVINEWCEDKDFNFVSEFYPKDDEEASNMTTQILNATPNVKFFFCFNNGYAIACSNEIGAAVSDATDYFVFSSEGDEESFRLIADESNSYRACAYMDIEESGYQVGLQLINWVENGTMDIVVVEKDLIEAGNVEEYMTEE